MSMTNARMKGFNVLHYAIPNFLDILIECIIEKKKSQISRLIPANTPFWPGRGITGPKISRSITELLEANEKLGRRHDIIRRGQSLRSSSGYWSAERNWNRSVAGPPWDMYIYGSNLTIAEWAGNWG